MITTLIILLLLVAFVIYSNIILGIFTILMGLYIILRNELIARFLRWHNGREAELDYRLSNAEQQLATVVKMHETAQESVAKVKRQKELHGAINDYLSCIKKDLIEDEADKGE